MMTMQRRCEKTVIYFHDLDLFCAIQLFLIVVTSLVKSARCCVCVNILGVGDAPLALLRSSNLVMFAPMYVRCVSRDVQLCKFR